MIFLKQSTASQSVLIGPFVDDTDGATAETGLTIANTDIRLSKAGGNMAAKNSGGGTHDEAGWYTITLDATDTATVGALQLSVDVAGALPVFAEFQVLEEAIYDALIGSGATGELLVDAVKISGDSTAADNLELQYDGTGYTDPNAPSTQSQVDSIGAASGGSVNIEATEDNTGGAIIDAVTFVGSVQSGTFASTEAEDGVYHDIDDTANDIDIVYGFDVGGARVATSVSFDGFVQASADEMKIKVYDHVGSDWETIGTIPGQNGTTNIILELPLLLKHTGEGAELGKVYIRFDTDSTTPANLSIDRLLVSAVTSSASLGFVNGAVWIDSVNGTSGTGAGVGTITSPVDNIDDALTIATANNLSDLHIAPGSTVTPTGAVANYDLLGHEYTIDFNGQSFTGSYIEGAFIAASTVTGSGIIFKECIFDSNVTLPPCTMRFCYWGNATITAGSTGDFYLNDCRSRVAGSGAPSFDFNAVAVGLSIRSYSGGLKLTNMAAGDTASIEGTGAITEVTSTGGSLALRGTFKQNSITNITVTQDDVKDSIDIITDSDGVVFGAAGVDLIWDEATSGHNSAGSFGKALRQIKESSISAETTVNDVSATTTSFVTNLTEATDEHYNDSTLIFTSGALIGQGKVITDYNGTTKAVSFDEAWTEAPADTDEFIIKTDHVHSISQISSGVWSASGRALSDPAGFKKNTAGDITFVLRDSSDGRTPVAGETVTAQRSIDGAAFGSCANSVTEIGNGAYIITLAAADLNGDIIILRFTSSGSDDLLITIKTET